jgi:hypothetical protein
LEKYKKKKIAEKWRATMTLATPAEIQYLIEQTTKIPMTQAQMTEQRRSFAYGNTAIENPEITREMVEEEARKIGL